MDLASVLKKAGSAVISSVVPGGGLIVDLINEFLPDNKKLPSTATGTDAQSAIDGLTPELRLKLMTRELDVQIANTNAWANVQQFLAMADSSGNSTRPTIANRMSWLVVLQVCSLTFAVLYAAVTKDTTVLDTLSNSWEMITASMGIPTAVLLQYFGKRTKEKLERYNLAMGNATSPFASTIKSFLTK